MNAMTIISSFSFASLSDLEIESLCCILFVNSIQFFSKFTYDLT